MPTADQINDLRRQILAGEDVTSDDLRGAIDTLAGERILAHTEADKKTSKRAPAKKVDLSDLL